MEQGVKRRGIFYGWWVVGGSLVIMTVGPGGAGYVFGVFFQPLLSEFGWNRAQVALASTVMFIVGGIAGPFVGRLNDRYGPRVIMVIGAVVATASLLLLARTGSLIELYIYYGLFSVGLGLAGMIPLASTVSNWFMEKRGRAVGILMTGVGWGGFLLIPFTTFIVQNSGWRTAYASLGILFAVVTIPVAIFVIRRRPQDKGLLPDGKTPEELAAATAGARAGMPAHAMVNWTVAAALRTASFWFMTLAFAFYFLGLMTVLIHGIPFFISKGIPPATAGTLLGTVALMGIIGKLSFGFLADRVPMRYLITLCFLIQAVALGLFVMVNSEAFAWIAVVIYGLSMGGIVAMMALIVVRNFGIMAFGTIFGASQVVTTIAGALSPVVAGMVFDATKSYTPVFLGYIVGAVLGAVCIFLAQPPQTRPAVAPSPALSDATS